MTRPSGRSGSIAPLRDATFRLFFAARAFSMLGSAMAGVALAFAVLDLTGSTSDLGLVLAARSIPMVLLMLMGGVVADRLSRSMILQVSNLGAAVTQGMVAALLLSGHPPLWSIIVLEFANGAIVAFTFPALQGIVPQVTPREHLQQANALMAMARNATSIVGPSVAGLVVVTIGSGWAIAFDALTYLVAALWMGRLRVPAMERSGGGSVVHDLRIGWTEFSSRTWLWLIVAAAAVLVCMQVGVITTLGPAIAKDTIGKGPWGLVLSAEAAGFLLMSVLLLRMSIRYPLRSGMLGLATPAVLMVLLGVHPTTLPLLAAGFVSGMGTEMFGIGWTTALQEHIPLESLSRVSSYDALGSFVAMPVGQILAGPMAGWFGRDNVAVGGGLIFAATALATLASPSVRNLQRVAVVETNPVLDEQSP
jgi:MFS family permease